eukprot:TRINITY_DN1280_c0_g1_i1.p1 TRINITY_DN1280_c0_g1~~TRINITY_DN1280_c0_g1_i1.p1  ORF type:complete len:308 (+),score=43.51 TRINITY_DN1280_c0_g1_i1:140-925(+)
MKDNRFITSGYRVNLPAKLCAQSLFRHHNETWNIWTHFVAAIFFLIMIVVIPLFILHKDATGMDYFVFLIFLFCATANMAFSALFHWFSCHSPVVYKWLAKLDYTGISVMIVGSYYPPMYYGFVCQPDLQVTYLVLISVLGIVGVSVSMVPMFASARFRVFRTVFFLIFGFFAVIPVPHMLILNGISTWWPVLLGLIVMGSLYTIGAVIYSTRVPERWFPGRFDLGLSSHVVWHFFTIAAALVQLWNCINAYWISTGVTCS